MTRRTIRVVFGATGALIAWTLSLSTVSAHVGVDHAGGLAHLEGVGEGIGLVAAIAIIGIAYWFANRGKQSESHVHGEERPEEAPVQSPLVNKNAVLQHHRHTREAPR